MSESDSVTLATAAFWTGLAIVVTGWWTDTRMVMITGAGVCLVSVLFEMFGPDISEREEMALTAEDLSDDEQ